MPDYVLAIDQGTTGTKALVVDAEGEIVAQAYRPVQQAYPRPGWVEVDALHLLDTVVETGREALERAGVAADSVAFVAIANQGETAVAWDRKTGQPLAPAISWQDRRTADRCRRLRAEGLERVLRRAAGLPLNPYFTATKWLWYLDELEGVRAKAARGEVLLGTTDSFFVWHLTGGTRHVTDVSTASRTAAFNIRDLRWDDALLEAFNLPRTALAEPLPHDGDFGTVERSWFGSPLPLRGLCVDQQAALFGLGCLEPGLTKVTYGTGTFVLQNCGPEPPEPSEAVLTTVAWQLSGRTTYALDGGIYTTGAAVQWVCQTLGILGDPGESEALARSVPDSGGVIFIPSLSGIGAPFWADDARGALLGLSLATRKEHVVRALLEGIACRVRDVVDAMNKASGQPVPSVRVDGGLTANGFLMQEQADLLRCPVEVSVQQEATALGVAYLGGVAASLWRPEEIQARWRAGKVYHPSGSADSEARYRRWRAAVEKVLQVSRAAE